MTWSETADEIRGSYSLQEKLATNLVDQDKQVMIQLKILMLLTVLLHCVLEFCFTSAYSVTFLNTLLSFEIKKEGV